MEVLRLAVGGTSQGRLCSKSHSKAVVSAARYDIGARRLHTFKTHAAAEPRFRSIYLRAFRGCRGMTATTRIGLIGDYDATVPAHQAIPIALHLAGDTLGLNVEFEWVPTDQIRDPSQLDRFRGLWCVPASPYRSLQGALLAIRFARERGRPFLGTCGGFQHAILEYARDVLGWADAEHAEMTPDADRIVIAPLQCALLEQSDSVCFQPGSRIASIYGSKEATEGYRCNYGLNPEFEALLLSGVLRATAHDATGAVRAVELESHPFFIATLFQPERMAFKGQLPPLVKAFVQAAQLARSEFMVRGARVEDAEDLVGLHYDAVHENAKGDYPPAILASWSPQPNEVRYSWMRSQIESEHNRVLVAGDRDGSVKGFCIFSPSEAFVFAVYVAPNFARKGMGRQLLRLAEAGIVERGLRQARLNASRNSLGFYIAERYEVVQLTNQSLADGSVMECYEMCKQLASSA